MIYRFASSALSRIFAVGLLSTSPLLYAQTNDKTSEAVLPEVNVVEEKDGSGYTLRNSSGATRTDTPLREVPQSVRVITAQQIDDLGALRLADTVDFVSGIARLNTFGGTWDNYAIRGFSSSEMGFLVNGFVGSRGYGPQRDTANIERFEFLKGPASAIYGSSEPGGTINIVTKKPQFTQRHTADLSVGSSGLRRTTLDSTGPLSKNLAYRLNLMAEQGDSRSSMLHNRRELIAPAFTWLLSSDTTLNYEGEYLHVKTPLDRGVINVRGVLGLVPRDRTLNEPADGNMTMSSNTHQLTLDQRLSPDWRARFGASYKESTFSGIYTEATTLEANNRTLKRNATWRQLPSRDTSLQAELEGKLKTGSLEHTLLFGAEASKLWMNLENKRNPNYPIDIYKPVYGQPVPVATTATLSTDEEQRVQALFMQDQISLSEKWKVLGGLRWDRYEQHIHNRLAKTPAQVNTTQHQSAVSPRAGVTYLPNDWSSLYLSVGQSFRANNGVGVDGRAFDPQHSTAYEAGWKIQTADQRLGANFAVFDITKTNVLTESGVPNFKRAAGEIKSSGFEADVYGQIDRHWRVSGNFAWTDARVTKDKTLPPGSRLTDIPRFSAGLLAIREDAFANGSRYGVGASANYVSDRAAGSGAESYTLPGYTIVKLLSYWQVSKNVRASLDVHNLFNRNYYPSSWNKLYVTPGAERNVVARLKIDF
ncbi:Ferrichrome-iron receptor precursor [compost metagenome]